MILEFPQVTSVDKREPRGTFLSLGLRPRLQKTFPRFPFVYFGNLGKTQTRGQKFFLRRVIEKKQNKIPLSYFEQKIKNYHSIKIIRKRGKMDQPVKIGTRYKKYTLVARTPGKDPRSM